MRPTFETPINMRTAVLRSREALECSMDAAVSHPCNSVLLPARYKLARLYSRNREATRHLRIIEEYFMQISR